MTIAGNFNGHIPNGKRISVMNFTVLKFSDNLIIYEGHYLDRAGLSLQSGIPLEALMPIKN
jgi:hypothetical protein